MAIKCQHKIIHLVDRYVKDINEAQDVAQETQTQPELKDTLTCYAVVSHALKTNAFLWISTDFATQIYKKTISNACSALLLSTWARLIANKQSKRLLKLFFALMIFFS